MPDTLKQIVLASRPTGAPTPDNFRLEEHPMPTPGAGEVLVRVHYMSLDPYMRGRMDDAKSYAASIPVDGKMEGGAVGEIIASGAKGFDVGQFVMGSFGWATHATAPAAELAKIDPATAPITYALGVLGMPGLTGWYGLTELGKPEAGETLVVAAATGPVGSMVGQIAKSMGLRTVGIAGGPDKCKMAVDHFGFDACLDHRAYATASDLRTALKAECPKGIDIYFENVGGAVFDAVLPLLNTSARIPICGLISQYNATRLPDGPDRMNYLMGQLLRLRATMRGFIVFDDFGHLYPQFSEEVGAWVRDGKIKYREEMIKGLEQAPAAFVGLLKGEAFGKRVVHIDT